MKLNYLLALSSDYGEGCRSTYRALPDLLHHLNPTPPLPPPNTSHSHSLYTTLLIETAYFSIPSVYSPELDLELRRRVERSERCLVLFNPLKKRPCFLTTPPKKSSLKLEQKRRKGLHKEALEIYLNERMWRQWRGGGLDVIMREFIAILQLQFPVDIYVTLGFLACVLFTTFFLTTYG